MSEEMPNLDKTGTNLADQELNIDTACHRSTVGGIAGLEVTQQNHHWGLSKGRR